MQEMGIDFSVETRPVDEIVPEGKIAEETAVHLSRLKAMAFKPAFFTSNKIIITADTIVVLGDKILGKPAHREEAVDMLKQLSGRSHRVITGVTIKSIEKEKSFFVSTDVFFKTLTLPEINYYIDHYSPFDKAGAYGIQEWIGHAGITKIEGSYFNVVGLPTNRLYRELEAFVEEGKD